MEISPRREAGANRKEKKMFHVGEKVLFYDYNDNYDTYKILTVTKITPTGIIRAESEKGSRFSFDPDGDGREKTRGQIVNDTPENRDKFELAKAKAQETERRKKAVSQARDQCQTWAYDHYMDYRTAEAILELAMRLKENAE